MCPNVWEIENTNQNRIIEPFKELLISYIDKKISNEPLNPYIGSKIFNNLINLLPENKRPENFITAADTKNAIEQNKRNGLQAGNFIIREGIKQWVSPRYSEIFFNDGRVGFVLDKNKEKNIFLALVIDNDYILRKYTFDRTKDIVNSYCLMKYKTP